MCLLTIYMSSLDKRLFRSPANFLIGFWGFLVLSYVSYLCIWKGGCFYLFIFGCWVFVHAYGLSLVGVRVPVVVASLVLESRP